MDNESSARLAWAILGAVFVSVSPIVAGMEEHQSFANVSRHLGVVGRVNLGSFYTPARYVRLVGEWLLRHGVERDWVIADLSCGYGAFFELGDVEGLHECRYLGNDIDSEAVEKARALFPNVRMSVKNALYDVTRETFGIPNDARLAIVGNPPYNDVTSQSNQSIKTNSVPIDADLRTRDLGMSSLLAYEKLCADYVAVLHPLSYLIKKTNFMAARRFFENYTLLDHVVFSSAEFAGTSKTSCFPVIVALYKRTPGNGLSYAEVRKIRFHTEAGDVFSLDGFDYVTDDIDKYPSERRYSPEILFYTLRDINALRRCRTFIHTRIANAVDVDPAKLAYYCYIDCFKRYADVPYYLGNFNVPFIRAEFASMSNDVVSLAKNAHPDIFGTCAKPTRDAESRVCAYIEKSLKGRDQQDADR